ncbi:MAG: hypothetical protein K2Q26_09650 [Bdellovibrionales bacterium]|nr:hypothetical protein [Bdellovibrionales bacterium]
MSIKKEDTFQLMEQGSTRPLKAIVSDLKTKGLTHLDLCHYIAEFITRRPLITQVYRLNRQSKILQFKKEYGPMSDTSILTDLVNTAENENTFAYKLISLFEQEYGDIRDVFIFIIMQRNENRIGYFKKLVESMSLRFDRPEWLDKPKTMFDGSFLAALQQLKAQGIPLQEVGGRTNTLLKLYDWCFDDEFKADTGFGEVIESKYDVCYDLGGGFTTPYLNERFKKNFICLDIYDPRTFEQDHQYLEKIYRESDMEYKPNEISFEYFDVFKNDYPLHFEKYLIASFGFLSSTIANLTPDAGGPKVFSTTYAAIEGISRLILAGKELTLCSYSRPSYAKFSSRCFTLKFKEERLVMAKSMTQDCHRDIGLSRTGHKRLKKFLRAVEFS